MMRPFHGHADAYIMSVRGRRSISVCVCVCVCVCVASQAIVGLQLHGGVDMFVFLPSVFLDFCTYTDGPGYKWSTLSTNGLGDE